MPYKYMSAMSYINDQTPKEYYRGNFQQLLIEEFYNSSDWYTIGEETYPGSSDYVEIDVRINNVVPTKTGLLQGDDFKTIMFKEIDHDVKLGYMYYFESNYWLVMNTTKIASLTSTATIRRCNNSLRWYDTEGGYHDIPCVLEYVIKENRDYATAGSALVLPSGFVEIMVQYNNATTLIRPNNRFLFGVVGNWTAYRLYGDGVNNFIDLTHNGTPGFLRLSAGASHLNYDTDDITNGIADGLQVVYGLTLSDTVITGEVGATIQLTSMVTLNSETVIKPVTWESDDETIATVDTNGLVTFVSAGSCNITCKITNNDSVYDTCVALTSATPVVNVQVVTSPLVNYILEGEEKTFSAYLYENGILLPDVFTFSLNANTVPSANYIYGVTGDNEFSVENIERFLTDKLEITCTSGIYSAVIEVYLRGAW